jgi:hypothetical protein
MIVKAKTRGSWGLRFFIIVLSIVLGVLLFWLLSFIENDIGKIAGPNYETVRREYVPQSYDLQRDEVTRDIQGLDRKIKTIKEQQQILNNSTDSLQNTISQLLDIQRESLQKNAEFPENSRQTLQESQSAFLQNQEKNQQYIRQVSELILGRQQKEEELTAIKEKIVLCEKEAGAAYTSVSEKHRLKIAAFKLSFLVPVFLIFSWLFMRYRTGTYWPLVWAAFLASFLKITFVAHEYFPSRYFKYIAILVVLAIVLRILVYLVRMIAAPKPDLLLKQYQQDYDKCLCPICSKPIRTGPLRFAGCRKRTAVVVTPQDSQSIRQEPYTCPSCGTTLYSKCDDCGQVRHTLLPYCEHCGKETNTLSAEQQNKGS